jgi:hypothetical protein
MRKTLLVTAMTGSLLVLLGSPVRADDFSISAPLVTGDRLPKKGTATYDGTYALSGVYAGVTGTVQFYVDFTTGDISADLTIPSLGSGGATSPPEHYTPSGVISLNGKKEAASYTLTQGVSFSNNSPFISMSGGFSGPRGRDTAGSFDANFCVPEPDCGGIYVVRSVTGTFSATKTR